MFYRAASCSRTSAIRKKSYKDQSNINRRLQQLSEENTVNKNDPLMKISRGMGEDDEQLTKIYEQLPAKEYQERFKDLISSVNSFTALNKHSRDIAMEKPWDGEESLKETSRRMLHDSFKALNRSAEYGAAATAFNNRSEMLENQNRQAIKSKKLACRSHGECTRLCHQVSAG